MVPLASRRHSGSSFVGTRQGERGGEGQGREGEVQRQKRGQERGGRRWLPATLQQGRDKDLWLGPPMNTEPEMKGEGKIRRGGRTGGEVWASTGWHTKRSAGGGSGGKGTK